MLAGKLLTARRVLRERGFLGLTSTTLKKLFRPGNPWLSWDARILLQCPASGGEGGPVRGQALAAGEASGWATKPAERRAAEAALRRGEVCWGIHDQGRLAARVWIGGPWSEIHSDTGFSLRLPDADTAWWWRDVYVLPECRRRGWARALVDTWRASLPPGEHRLFTEVDPANPPSLPVHLKMGFSEIARLHMLCLLGLRFYWCRGHGQPRLSWRFIPRNLYYSSRR